MAKANKRRQARQLASQGANVRKIRRKTGVNQEAAQRFVQQASAQSQAAAAPTPTAPPPTTPPARTTPNTPTIRGVGQGLKIAGGGGITKNELDTILEASGKTGGQLIGKLDKVNAKLKERGLSGINLNSGAANFLIRQATKGPKTYGTSKEFNFGTGRIGETLQSMIPTQGLSGYIKGEKKTFIEGDPGFNPGGRPDKNRMIGGTSIRPGGRITVSDWGKNQFVPAEVKEEAPAPEEEAPVDETPIEDTPIEEVEEEDKSASSGAGGLDLASWATGFKKAQSARQKAGRQAQGLASQKKSPFKSWNS